MKPIPTRYHSCFFRSRLEARWAVAFDHMKIKWLYEPEGFLLPSGNRYLPDFLLSLPNGKKLWVEIKPHGEVSGLFEEFVEHSNHYSTLLREIPDPEYVRKCHCYYEDLDEPHVWWPGGDGWDCHHVFCACPKCETVGFEFSGRAERIGCCEAPDNVRFFTADHDIVLDAFTVAREARFEHGENPAPQRRFQLPPSNWHDEPLNPFDIIAKRP